ncbi:MAG: hypothetical protein GDA36_03735 [Rhodobacteraceae bacterium]|nr:hypothetical protein [Paracoccaceae bacterium]
MTKGGRANKRGRVLEMAVNNLLSEEYENAPQDRFFALRSLNQPIFAEQCYAGRDIYGKNRRVDFILYHPTRWPDCLVIQCKWQASSGSVEEKYPFEVLSIQKSALKTIIVLDGEGYSDGAKQWLMNEAGKNKLLYVLSLAEITKFQSYGKI